MIETLWGAGCVELWSFLGANFDPVRDTIDIVLVTLGIYWLLLLIRGTRAVQILVGLLVLIALSVASRDLPARDAAPDPRQLPVLGGADHHRALPARHPARARARGPRLLPVRRGAPGVADRSRRSCAPRRRSRSKRVGALIVLERETGLDDQIEAGTPLDAAVTKDLLLSLFLPYSPLHDGAVVIQNGRIAYAGCILPLTLRSDLPEGVGTRHRAAVGITEETDARRDRGLRGDRRASRSCSAAR